MTTVPNTASPRPAPAEFQPTTGAAVRFPFPPALFALPLAGALVLERRMPLPLGGTPALSRAGTALTMGGVAFSLSAVATVLRHKTTVVPHRPVFALVTNGPYRVSRNPMYAGQAVSLVGTAVWTRSWWPLLACGLAVVLTQRLVIDPEEDYLGRRFGPSYADYRSRVRRWL